MPDFHYDLCVIGGGINGTGIARDAAGRGLSVLLLEAQDLAGGTSSASTKLIHGGLRYLENYEFSMVRAALKEREVLLKNAPHLIRPVEIIIPHQPHLRPRWIIKAGLFLYDRLGGRSSLPRSKFVDFSVDNLGKPLKKHFRNGFSYSDGWGDDTRLVIANALGAAQKGARISTYTACIGLKEQGGGWDVEIEDAFTGERAVITAKSVINATGPWVGQFLERVGLVGGDPALPQVRMVKGSHIILPRQYEGAQIYLLQQPDGRIVFVVPYEGQYTLVGTTEEAYSGDPREAKISADETAYLCNAVNVAFEKQISGKDIVFTYSGVRPLLDDGKANTSKVTRDYRIYHHARYSAPLLSVYGGKLTTYRILSESVVDKLVDILGMDLEKWTEHEVLPGGDIEGGALEIFLRRKMKEYSWLSEDLIRRYVGAYGARIDLILSGKKSYEDMGMDFGDGVYQAEIDYLVNHEWARSVEDIIWRRSKLGLHIADKAVDNLRDYLSKTFPLNP